MSIKQMFDFAYQGSPNIMTPHVIRYGKRGKYLYELSKGEGISKEPIFGVTLLNLKGEKQHDLSKGGFTSQKDAESYIKTL